MGKRSCGHGRQRDWSSYSLIIEHRFPEVDEMHTLSRMWISYALGVIMMMKKKKKKKPDQMRSLWPQHHGSSYKAALRFLVVGRK